MLTARGTETDKVLGLELGADDYVTKPFGMQELLARVRALLRRAETAQEAPAPQTVASGDLLLDLMRREAQRGAWPLRLKPKEFDLLLALVRKIPRASTRVRDANFSLDGLVGFDLNGKTFGTIGTGRIGAAVVQIAHGFGCNLLGYDPRPNTQLEKLGLRYVGLDEIYRSSDIISLHVPLTPATDRLINREALAKMKRGVIILNTGRGALISSRALIDALKSGQVGGAGLDVYEEEEGLFFRDLSEHVLQDDVLARLLTFPNVVITSHQAFLTREALANIAETTLANVSAFEHGQRLVNEVRAEQVIRPPPPPPQQEQPTMH
jgi:phosphoglycerate dehydrogenase-like enzyme